MNRPILIFDLDGTLSDPREGIVRCMRHALEDVQADVPPASALEGWIGPPLHEAFATFLGDHEKALRAVAAYREEYGKTGLYENRLYDDIEGALETLHHLSPAMFVATSKPTVFAIRSLEHVGLLRYFRAVYGSELSGERANKVELLRHLMDAEQLRPEELVMIGDRMHDVAAARAHGIRSVGVTWGFGSDAELRDAGADNICSSVSDLVAWYRDDIIASRP